RWRKPVGQSERTERVGSGEDGKAIGLEAPELLILSQIVEMLHQCGKPALVEPHSLHLFARLFCQVPEFDAARVRILGQWRGLQVDRDTGICPDVVQSLEFGPGGQVDMK